MNSPLNPRSRDTEQWIVAPAISILLLIGGAVLIVKGVRGAEEGALLVTRGSMKAGTLSPVHAIVAGGAAFALGLYVGRIARRKKREIEGP